ANSQLLRDVMNYHAIEKKGRGEIAERLISAGFAERSKSKVGKERGIVTEVGPVAAESVLDFFQSQTGKKILSRIRELRIETKSEKVSAKKMKDLPLSGKIFVLTGTLPSITRDEASQKIEALGGHGRGSVSKITVSVLA